MNVPGCKQLSIEANGFRYNVYFKPSEEKEGVLICHHGIGSCALTFAVFLAHLNKLNPRLGFLTYDARHHGYTVPLNEMVNTHKIDDLDLDTLQSDFETITAQVLPKDAVLHICLLGHSMGGTLMAKYANCKTKPHNYDVRGLIVVDAVEGYARQSLSTMHTLLNIWPSSFSSTEEAIKWHLHQGSLLRNKVSAQVSVPPLFKLDSKTNRLVWKLDLSRTDSNWDSWFANLDEYFISAPAARLLILAGVGRLDTALTRAQMQGKFQLMPVNEAGHYIHEDAPEKVAHAVDEFWTRNGKPIQIIPKFGQIRSY